MHHAKRKFSNGFSVTAMAPFFFFLGNSTNVPIKSSVLEEGFNILLTQIPCRQKLRNKDYLIFYSRG